MQILLPQSIFLELDPKTRSVIELLAGKVLSQGQSAEEEAKRSQRNDGAYW